MSLSPKIRIGVLLALRPGQSWDAAGGAAATTPLPRIPQTAYWAMPCVLLAVWCAAFSSKRSAMNT